MLFKREKFSIFVVILQVVFILIFAFLGEYGPSAKPSGEKESIVPKFYPMFQDVHVMIFIGFGFLMTFLKRYGYSAVGINFLVAAFVLQWATIVRGFINDHAFTGGKIKVNVEQMLSADFAAATVLISFGAVLGKTSPLQLIIMALIEVVFSQVNEWVGFHYLWVADVGESMFVHAFGAYFGLAVARVLYSEDIENSKKEGSVYHSDLFSMIGTVFLWLYWPSFNGGAAGEDEQHRAVLNTYFSLAACCIVTFAISGLVDKKGKFDMVHIQNATLAGGVAVGTVANMPVEPWGALLIGSVAAILSVVGFKYITPFLRSRAKVHDTCGVNNLHGMPGLLAGIIGAIMAALATEDKFRTSLFEIFEAMAPSNKTHGQDRSGVVQGGYQMAALGGTLAIAIVGGVITGFILKLPFWDNPENDGLFDDDDFWIVAEEGRPEVEGDYKVKVNEANFDTRM